MTKLKIAFKTDNADKDDSIDLTTLINTLSSVKASLNLLSHNSIAYNFKHTKISSFAICIDMQDKHDEDILFESRDELYYDEYACDLENIINLNFTEKFKNKRHSASIKKLLKTISNQSEDVEISFNDTIENKTKIVYLENSKARKAFVFLRNKLSPTNNTITGEGNITTLSVNKKYIGLDFNGENIEIRANEKIVADIIHKKHEIGDTVEFSVEKMDNKTFASLLYLHNITKFPKLL